MGLPLYPRGGSAQVARYLAAALDRKGWPVRLFTGSLGEPGTIANAATFFSELDLAAADFTPALEGLARGDDPMAAGDPAASIVRGSCGSPRPTLRLARRSRGRTAGRRLGAAIRRGRGRAEAALAHLHHLTPQHDALARVAPNLPVVAHLHGTELKMLDGIRLRRELALRLGTDLRGWPRTPRVDGSKPGLPTPSVNSFRGRAGRHGGTATPGRLACWPTRGAQSAHSDIALRYR